MKFGSLLNVIRRLGDHLDSAGIEYFVGGAVSSCAYGEFRSTNSADFCTAFDQIQVEALAKELDEGWHFDIEQIFDAIASRSKFPVVDFETMLKADVFILKRDHFMQSQFKRRVRETITVEGIEPFETWLCSPEDIVLQKLKWYRMGGERSDQQWRDVMGVLIYQVGKLDIPYMEHWADKLGVADLLAQVREDARRPWDP